MSSDVAAILDLSVSRVLQLDEVLQPERVAVGDRMTVRFYDPELVEAVRRNRAAAKAAKAEKKAARDRRRAQLDARGDIGATS